MDWENIQPGFEFIERIYTMALRLAVTAAKGDMEKAREVARMTADDVNEVLASTPKFLRRPFALDKLLADRVVCNAAADMGLRKAS